MPRSEAIREENAWLRLVFGLLAVVAISLAGWLAGQYGSGEWSKLSLYSPAWRVGLGAGILLCYMSAMMFFIDQTIHRNIKELGELP